MKKFCCVACVVLLMLVVCIPCFAESTTSAEPIDWLGGGVSYQFSGTSSNAMTLAYFNKNNGFFQSNPCSVVSGSATIRSSSTTKSFSSMYSNNGGDYVYVLWEDSSTYSSYSQSELLNVTFVLSSMDGITNTTYWTVTEVGSEGLIDSGVNASISYLGSVLTYIWTTPAIMTCIGLAVGVVLIGWGISKVKDLVVGY